MIIKDLFKKYRGVILYLVFGVMTTLINVLAYDIAYKKLGINNVVSTIIAWVVAVSFAFITNKLFVFGSKKKNMDALKEAVSFITCRIATGVVEVGMMWAFVDLLRFDGTVMKLVTNIVIIVINYIASKFFVFRGEGNERE